jgi:hypothetical protein
VCADSSDLDPTGQLPPKNPAYADSGVDALLCPTGSETCACYPNDTCNAGLTCASQLCVRLGTGGTTGRDAGSGNGGAGGTSALRVWNLAQDLLANATSISPSNPFADSAGTPGVWHIMFASGLAYDPTTYRDIPNSAYSPDTCGCSGSMRPQTGLPNWDNTCTPPGGAAWINIEPSTISSNLCAPTQVLPSHKAFAHPGPSNLVLYAWKSPISGGVSITGGLADVDCDGAGNGITWRVDWVGAGAGIGRVTTLASGAFENCGASTFPPNLKPNVALGDLLYFIVDPKGEWGGDATQVDVTITSE